MISRRSFVLLRTALPLFALALAACDRATDPTQPTLRSGTATFDKKPVPKGVISARVLTNKAGVSVLEVRTGTFDNATNTGTPDGTFEKIEYTIYQNDPGKKPKKIFERNVNFKRSSPNFFSEVISICKKSDEDDPPCEHRDGGHYDDHYDHGDDHDGYDGGHDGHDQKPQPPCPLQAGKSYSISIEADLEGVGAEQEERRRSARHGGLLQEPRDRPVGRKGADGDHDEPARDVGRPARHGRQHDDVSGRGSSTAAPPSASARPARCTCSTPPTST